MSLTPATLPDDVPALQALARRQMAELERLRLEHRAAIERLREQLNLALARRFGVASEQIPESQLRLFNEAEAGVEMGEAVEESAVEVPAHTRRKPGRRPLPESLPTHLAATLRPESLWQSPLIFQGASRECPAKRASRPATRLPAPNQQ